MCCLHVHKITKKRTFLVCRETYLGDRSMFVWCLIVVRVQMKVTIELFFSDFLRIQNKKKNSKLLSDDKIRVICVYFESESKI